ncbi:MAG: hypothetical protein ABR922_17215, partial [Streptosporangiaceae bacterium]
KGRLHIDLHRGFEGASTGRWDGTSDTVSGASLSGPRRWPPHGRRRDSCHLVREHVRRALRGVTGPGRGEPAHVLRKWPLGLRAGEAW